MFFIYYLLKIVELLPDIKEEISHIQMENQRTCGGIFNTLKCSPKECMDRVAKFLRDSIFDEKKFFFFGPSAGVLLTDSGLFVNDIDVQVVVEGEDEKNNIIQNFEDNKFKHKEKSLGKMTFVRDNINFNVSFLEENKRGGFYLERSDGGKYPVDGYLYKGKIGYMKPELLLQVAQRVHEDNVGTIKNRLIYLLGKKGRQNEKFIKMLKGLVSKENKK